MLGAFPLPPRFHAAYGKLPLSISRAPHPFRPARIREFARHGSDRGDFLRLSGRLARSPRRSRHPSALEHRKPRSPRPGRFLIRISQPDIAKSQIWYPCAKSAWGRAPPRRRGRAILRRGGENEGLDPTVLLAAMAAAIDRLGPVGGRLLSAERGEGAEQALLFAFDLSDQGIACVPGRLECFF